MTTDNNKDVQSQGIAGERSLPNVNTARRSRNNGAAMFFGFFAIIFMVIFGYFTFFTKDEVKENKVQEVRVQTRGIVIDPLPLPPPPPPPPPVEEPKVQPVEKIIEAPPAPPPVVIDHTRSSLMIFANDKKEKPTELASDSDTNNAFSNKEGERTNLGSKMTPTTTERVSAIKMQHPNYTLAKGTLINCSLQTKIDSSIPGFVSCVITRDIYGDTGRVLLIERGSQVVGEYQSTVENGLNRIFILWSRVKTPNGITVELNSPAADPLGGAGAPGYVDGRFWQRFGTALLLSMVDQGINVANDLARIKMATKDSNKEDGSNNNNNNNDARINFEMGSVTSPLSDTINAVLSRQANIPDIMIKNQGESISIFVARDLDFSTVYDVKPY